VTINAAVPVNGGPVTGIVAKAWELSGVQLHIDLKAPDPWGNSSGATPGSTTPSTRSFLTGGSDPRIDFVVATLVVGDT
jgi:hypothetical protein